METAPLAHLFRGLISSICFYCPLLGTAKGKADPLGSTFPLFISLCDFRGAAEPQVGVPMSPRSSGSPCHLSQRSSSCPSCCTPHWWAWPTRRVASTSCMTLSRQRRGLQGVCVGTQIRVRNDAARLLCMAQKLCAPQTGTDFIHMLKPGWTEPVSTISS